MPQVVTTSNTDEPFNNGNGSSNAKNVISESNAERLEGFEKDESTGFSRRRRRSSVNSNETGDSSQSKMSSFWTKLAKKEDVWAEDEDEDEWGLEEEHKPMQLFTHAMANVWEGICLYMSYIWKSLKKHKYIGLAALVSFIVLAVVCIAITLSFANGYSEDLSNAALDVAAEQGQWFSDQLDVALLPLFSMAQFVKELDYFRDLPFQIGPGGQEGSAPYVPKFIERDGLLVYTHRNVTGICDDPELVENFNRIAKNIKEAAGMERVLVNVQLAPQAVVCLLYPMNNTEDFDAPTYMDNTGAWGHDLLQDPARRFIAEATVPADGVVAVGPLTLRQCGDCEPVVKDAIIARMPINFPPEMGYNINVNGQNYSSWGFTVVLINWGALVGRSDVHSRFKSNGMEFILSSTNNIYNEQTREYYTVRKTLAMSDNAMDIGAANFVNTTLKTVMNVWEMSVGYENGLEAPWKGAGIAISVILSLVLSIMLMLILIEKQNHLDLLKEMLPKKAMKKVQKGEVCVERYRLVTIFFSDIVGYTTMSSNMSPIQVMKMLNQFYCEVDKIADKNKVYKIEVIGDAYMCVVGCPEPCLAPEGAQRMALFALDMIELVKNFRMDDGSKIFVRAGLHSGPVVGGKHKSNQN